MSSSVEDLSYWSETFLSSCVPDLHLEDLIFNLNQVGAEFYTNSHIMVLFELIFDKSFQDTRLTNTYNKNESSDDTELLDMKNTIKFLND